MSHDFKTGYTTALLIGHGVTILSDLYKSSLSYIDDKTLVSIHARQSMQILAMIISTALFWEHPMILPVLLLQNLSDRSDAFSTTILGQNVFDIEGAVGVAFPNRVDSASFTSRTREDLHELTASVHANMVQILFARNVFEWLSGCCEFLLELHDGLSGQLHSPMSTRLEALSVELREVIEHISASTKSLKHFVATLKERAQSQLDVVSIFGIPDSSY